MSLEGPGVSLNSSSRFDFHEVAGGVGGEIREGGKFPKGFFGEVKSEMGESGKKGEGPFHRNPCRRENPFDPFRCYACDIGKQGMVQADHLLKNPGFRDLQGPVSHVQSSIVLMQSAR